MTRVTALIAEDEPLMRERLKEKLAHAWPELDIVAEAADGDKALALCNECQPQVAFLDIRMPGLTGLDVAAAIGGDCHVVFITAFDQYAIKAFDAGAVDYLLKPVESDRLAAAVTRLRKNLASPPADLSGLLAELRATMRSEVPRMKWIRAAIGKQVKLIPVCDVVYFQADTKYTRVVTASGEALIRRSLRELQEQLDPSCFWPIHRSTIVNANAIAGVSRDFRGRVSVKLKSRSEKLPVSEGHEHLFRQM